MLLWIGQIRYFFKKVLNVLFYFERLVKFFHNFPKWILKLWLCIRYIIYYDGVLLQKILFHNVYTSCMDGNWKGLNGKIEMILVCILFLSDLQMNWTSRHTFCPNAISVSENWEVRYYMCTGCQWSIFEQKECIIL